MDAKFQKYQNEELENVQFGQLDDMLATDVAAYQLQNPSKYSDTNLNHPWKKFNQSWWTYTFEYNLNSPLKYAKIVVLANFK